MAGIPSDAGHGQPPEQITYPSPLNVPSTQGVQPSVPLPKNPSTHRQFVFSVFGKEFAGHVTQLDAPILFWNSPAGHNAHTPLLFAPVMLLYFPAPHAVHCANSIELFHDPGAHSTQYVYALSLRPAHQPGSHAMRTVGGWAPSHRMTPPPPNRAVLPVNRFPKRSTGDSLT